MPPLTVMIDTWAWIALYSPPDQYHERARAVFAVMQQRQISTAFTGDSHFRILGFTTRPQL